MAKRGRPKLSVSDKKYYEPRDANYTNVQNSLKLEKLLNAYTEVANFAGIELSWSYKERLKKKLRLML